MLRGNERKRRRIGGRRTEGTKGTGKPGGAGMAGGRGFIRKHHTQTDSGIRIVEFGLENGNRDKLTPTRGQLQKGKSEKLLLNQWTCKCSRSSSTRCLGKGREIVAINVLTRQIILALKQSRDKYTS